MQFYDLYANSNLDNIGTAHNNGSLIIYDASGTEVATLTFGSPAFSTASGGQMYANALSSDSSAAGGVADYIETNDSTGGTIARFTLSALDDTGSNTDFKLTSLTIGAGDSVNLPVSPGLYFEYTTVD